MRHRPETTLETVDRLERRAQEVMTRLHTTLLQNKEVRELNLRFPMARATEMVGRTPPTIRSAEADGRLVEPPLEDNGRRAAYTFEQIHEMRRVFGTLPRRPEGSEAAIVAVQNFKGGVGKSTLVTHIAQGFALKGYRVCVIDADSQGTSTTLHGFNPDVDIKDEETLLPFLQFPDVETIDYAVRKTHWPNLDLIPANLGLYGAEYTAARRIASDANALDELGVAVRKLSQNYDIVLLDPPPALGMISLSVLRAANALLIPTPPSTVDFASTTHFLSMLRETIDVLENRMGASELSWMKIIATKFNKSKSAHSDIKFLMEKTFGGDIFPVDLLDSAEIETAAASLRTVWETPASTETHRRCRQNIEKITNALEDLFLRDWGIEHEDLGGKA